MSRPRPTAPPPLLLRARAFLQWAGRSRFVRNVTIVASGSAAAQAITMAFSPVITRLYGPEAFGLLGVFTALVTMIAPVAALAYPVAIVLPRADPDARGLARLSFRIAALASGLAAVALLAGGRPLLAKLGSEAIAPYALLAPLCMFLAACDQVTGQWLIRKKMYGVTARIAVIQVLAQNGLKTAVGWFAPSGAALILLATVGRALHPLLLWRAIARSDAPLRTGGKDRPDAAPHRTLARRYYDFPLYRAPELFLNGISQNLPVLMLATFFGPGAAGYFALGRTVLGLPSHLIGSSVGDVFYPRITEAAQRGESLSGLVARATGALAVLGFAPFGAVVAFGPRIFSLVFGSEWVTAGQYARWTALWLYFGFLNNPSIRAIPVLSAQRLHLVSTVLLLATRVAALAVGFHVFHSDRAAIALFGITGALHNAALIAIVFALSLRRDRSSRGAWAREAPG